MKGSLLAGSVMQSTSRVYYVKGININYSFVTLESIAKKYGAVLEEGDIIVCDNVRGDKRKALKKTKHGWVIFYAKFHRHDLLFDPLSKRNGVVRGERPLVTCL